MIEGYSVSRQPRTDSDSAVWQARVKRENPYFDGHFPGNPVLPAIAQLILVERLMQATIAENVGIVGLRRVRFLESIRPNDDLSIEIRGLASPGTGSFCIVRDQRAATRGSVSWRARE